MEYYLFMGHRLARIASDIGLGSYEWLLNGEWGKNDKLSLALNDARMNYGDYSIGDQDHIKPEIAEELVQNGTIVLQGNVGYGTTYCEPKTIRLSNWKKPTDQT